MKVLPQETTVSNHCQSLGDAPRAVNRANAFFASAAEEYREQQRVEQMKDLAASKPVVRAGASACASRFVFVDYASIRFDPREEWLVKDLLPRQGVMTLYGQSCSFKSFVLLDWSVRIAAGWPIAGRSVAQGAVCYICAEGGNGFRKRVEGLRQWYGEELPATLPFRLLTAAPNLGTERNDLDALIAAVESAGAPPAMIVIDTLNKVLGGGDENNQGMVAVLGNATELTRRFNCAVILIHHEGHAKKNGAPGHARGHSSLMPSMDAHAHIQRKDDRSAIIAMRKIKDEESSVRLKVTFRRIVIGVQDDDSETSTLVVSDIAQTYEAMPSQSKPPAARLPDGSKLLMQVITKSLAEAGKWFLPEQGAGKVKGVSEDAVRREYYDRVAEGAKPDDKAATIASRQRKAFDRAIKLLIDRELLVAYIHEDQRFLCLPSPAPGGTRDTPKEVCPTMSRSPIAKGAGRSETLSRYVPVCPDVPLGQDLGAFTDAGGHQAELDALPAETDALTSPDDALVHGPDALGAAMSPNPDAVAGPVRVDGDDVECLSYEPDNVSVEPPDQQPPPWSDDDFDQTPCDVDGPHPDFDENGDVWL